MSMDLISYSLGVSRIGLPVRHGSCEFLEAIEWWPTGSFCKALKVLLNAKHWKSLHC